MGAWETHLANLRGVEINVADLAEPLLTLFADDLTPAVLNGYLRRATLAAASATTVQFAASTNLTAHPIVLMRHGRVALLTALPSALTISGGAGTKYIYADLPTPTGRYATTVTLAQSTTAPDSEATEYRVALGEVTWSGTAITALTSYDLTAGTGGSSSLANLHGECRLVLSGATLKLERAHGKFLRINGEAVEVPAAGVTLSAAGTSASTLYYIYAYLSAGTLTLEASTTAYTTHTDGVLIKTGDSSRTFVGWARTTAGTAWADSTGQRLVSSLFHPRYAVATAKPWDPGQVCSTFGSIEGGWQEMRTCFRLEFLAVDDRPVMFMLRGEVSPPGAGANRAWLGIGLDATATGIVVAAERLNNDPIAFTIHSVATTGDVLASTHYHYATVYAQATASGTMQLATSTWEGTETAFMVGVWR